MDSKTFIQRLSHRLESDPHRTAEMVAALAEIVRANAMELNAIAVPSFGTISAVKHDESVSTDLSTGRKMLLPPQITIEFSPASMLKKKLSSHE